MHKQLQHRKEHLRQQMCRFKLLATTNVSCVNERKIKVEEKKREKMKSTITTTTTSL